MKQYLNKFNTTTEYNTFKNSANYIKPNVSVCVDNKIHYNPLIWAEEYFTTVALENGTISFSILRSIGTDKITSISYSTNNGETWITTNNINNKSEHLVIDVNVNRGDNVLWKGIATQMADLDDWGEDYCGSFFSSTCKFDAKGNVMSLLYGDNYKGQTIINENYVFCRLFYDYDRQKTCNIVNAKDLSLPATTLGNYCYYGMFESCTSLVTVPQLPATILAEHCYYNMFHNCTSLTTAPKLPATTLASGCYISMFHNCTSLTTAPELPATTLANNCYNHMFASCTSLVTAPELPATTLANNCYYYMFDGCTNLVNAPELPATTLVNDCYNGMFKGCKSLIIAPELPATTLANYCYQYMFNGCKKLNYIKAMFTTTPSTTYTNNWVNGVASTGTFVKNSAATWTTTGVNGIPTGWTVETADS